MFIIVGPKTGRLAHNRRIPHSKSKILCNRLHIRKIHTSHFGGQVPVLGRGTSPASVLDTQCS